MLPVPAVSLDKVGRASLTMPQQYKLVRLSKIYRNRVEARFQPASSHTKSVDYRLLIRTGTRATGNRQKGE